MAHSQGNFYFYLGLRLKKDSMSTYPRGKVKISCHATCTEIDYCKRPTDLERPGEKRPIDEKGSVQQVSDSDGHSSRVKIN